MLFEVLVLGVFLGPLVFDFYRFLARFGVPVGAHFGNILGFEIDAENEAILGRGRRECGTHWSFKNLQKLWAVSSRPAPRKRGAANLKGYALCRRPPYL